MNIVKVSGHACVRSTKEAIGLIETGYPEVHMIAKKVPYIFEAYKTFALCAGTNHYLNAIKVYDKIADIWHVHNEPTWFVSAIKEISDKPVVLDVHDSYCTRLTPEEADEMQSKGETPIRLTSEERNNFQLADGLVFCAESFGEAVRKEFGLDQPWVTLYSYVPHRFYRYKCREYLGGLVYEGKVEITEDVKATGNIGFRYADYSDLAKQCHDMNMDFHIYCPRHDQKYLDIYKNIAYVQEPQAYENLLKALTRHDWGLVGNVFPCREWEVAMPNKLFEYVAACVPVVAINAKESEEFVEKHGIGISVKSMEELASRWEEHRKIRQRLIKIRQEFIMEKHIHYVTDLYNRLLNG